MKVDQPNILGGGTRSRVSASLFAGVLAGGLACGLTSPATAQECAYVGNQLIGTVRVLSLPDGEDLGSVELPGCSAGLCQLTEMVIREQENLAYVSQLDGNQVWVVDTTFEEPPRSIAVATSPTDLALGPGGAPLYAISLATSELVEIDVESETEVGRVDLPAQSRGLVLTTDGTALATTSRSQNAVFELDIADGSTIQMATTGERPIDVALTSDDATAYVVAEDGSLTEVDLASGTATDSFTVGSQPSAVRLAADDATAYVVNRGDSTVSIVNLDSGEVTDVDVGQTPISLALSDDGLLVTANLQGESLSLIDTGNTDTVLDDIDAGVSPFALAVAACPPQAATCVGDCNADGSVAINELIQGVNINLGALSIESCPAFDTNDNQIVEISELIRAVNNSLGGCPAE